MADKGEEALEAALARVQRVVQRSAEKSGLALNPDLAVRRHVLRGLARNLVSYGKPYCPCREVAGSEQVDRANICPCRAGRKEVARSGECECGLFVARQGGSA
jgi:ferredoxin-thioredoxin reductase catalytic subunit